jgi:hypothetical protein
MTAPSKRRLAVAGFVAVAALLVAGCAPASPPVGGVPGTYTFSQHVQLGPTGFFYGPVGGTATVCVTERTSLQIVQTAGFGGGFVSVTFDGASQYGSLSFATPWITDPVGPSCGQLSVDQGPGFFDPNGTLTITVSVTAA